MYFLTLIEMSCREEWWKFWKHSLKFTAPHWQALHLPSLSVRTRGKRMIIISVYIGSVTINILYGAGDACRPDVVEALQSPTNSNAINNAARTSSSLNGTFGLFPSNGMADTRPIWRRKRACARVYVSYSHTVSFQQLFTTIKSANDIRIRYHENMHISLDVLLYITCRGDLE